MTKQMIIAAAFAACSAFAQDATPPSGPEAPSDAPDMQLPPPGGRDRQGPGPEQGNFQMGRINPGIMIIGEELVLAKYDTDKDGKLSDEEKATLQADVKKAQEAKKATFMKKYDKDGDGKLSDEEKKAMREDWAKDNPKAAKRMEEMKARQEARKAEMLKKYDKDGDGKLSDEEKKAMQEDRGKGHAAPGGPQGPGMPQMNGPRHQDGPMAEGPQGPKGQGPEGPMAEGPRGPEGQGRMGGQGHRGDRNRGPRGNRQEGGPRPQLDPNRAPIMAAGWILIEEKYDTDKDGKLNESEMAQLNADAEKALEARRAARKNNGPLPPAPAQEGENK